MIAQYAVTKKSQLHGFIDRVGTLVHWYTVKETLGFD